MKKSTNLTDLILADTLVTDTGLQHLKGLTKLTILDLTNTKVTPQGIADLKNALPKCKITYTDNGETKTTE